MTGYPEPLLKLTDKGLYCPAADFFIDPLKPVKKALITHAHADHARAGSTHYLATDRSELLLRARLGQGIQLQTLAYGEQLVHNGVSVSFHPAGHVLGAAQIRVEHKGEVWVVSGDYKRDADPTCCSFEPVRCHAFITEATFALPIFRWPDPQSVYTDINHWWQKNREQGILSVLFAYSLGKAQRLLAGIDTGTGKVFTHGALENINKAYRQNGVPLPDTIYAGQVQDKKECTGALLLAPPSAHGTPWLKRFGSHTTAFASGWMLTRGVRRRRALDRGFVLSDHADWPGLLTTIEETGAEQVYTTHGYTHQLARWLNEQGTSAAVLELQQADGSTVAAYRGDDETI